MRDSRGILRTTCFHFRAAGKSVFFARYAPTPRILRQSVVIGSTPIWTVGDFLIKNEQMLLCEKPQSNISGPIYQYSRFNVHQGTLFSFGKNNYVSQRKQNEVLIQKSEGLDYEGQVLSLNNLVQPSHERNIQLCSLYTKLQNKIVKNQSENTEKTPKFNNVLF